MKSKVFHWVQGASTVISELGKVRLEEHETQTCLENITRPCLRNWRWGISDGKDLLYVFWIPSRVTLIIKYFYYRKINIISFYPAFHLLRQLQLWKLIIQINNGLSGLDKSNQCEDTFSLLEIQSGIN